MSKSILIRFLVFFCLVFVLDFSVGVILKKLYYSQKRGTNFRTSLLFDKTKKDLIVLGSSRASHHYVPIVFTDSLGLSCYNGGRDGTLFDFSYAATQALFARYTPKVILIDINLEDFYINNRANEGLQSLIPYYHAHQELRGLINNVRGPLETYKHISFCYPYNSTILNSLSNIVRAPNPQDTSGYLPLEGSLDGFEMPETFDFENSLPNKKRLEFLAETAKLCKVNGTRLIVVQSPRFGIYKNHTILEEIKTTLLAENAIFISYDNSTEYMQQPKLFKDASHLNEKGAMYFTQSILKVLQKTLSNQ